VKLNNWSIILLIDNQISIDMERNLSRDISLGIVLGINLLIISLSLASIAFSGEAKIFIAYGIYSCLIASFIIIVINVLRSQFAFLLSASSINYAIIISGVISSIIASNQLANTGATLATIIALIVLTTIWLSFCFAMLSWYKLGNIARFFPYSVNRGYVGGIALVVILAIFKDNLNTDWMLTIFQAPEILNNLPFLLIIAYGLFTFVLSRIFNSYIVVVSIFFITFIAFYVIAYLLGSNYELLKNSGYFLTLPHDLSQTLGLSLSSFKEVHWSLLLNYIPQYLALTVIILLSFMLRLSSIQLLVEEQVDLNKEIKIFSFANLLSGLAGGFTNDIYIGNSAINHKYGGTRIVGAISAVILFVALLNIKLVEFIPLFTIYGMLFYICLDLCYINLFKTFFTSTKAEFISAFLIAIIMASFSILNGVIFGILVALIFFFVRYQKVETIKQITDATRTFSYVERNEIEKELLDKIGIQVLIIKLQAYLFFGNNASTFAQIKQSIKKYEQAPLKYVIIDFAAVDGIESMIFYDFEKLIKYLLSINVTLCCCEAPSKFEHHFEQMIEKDKLQKKLIMFPKFNHALEYCENKLLNQLDMIKNMSSTQRLISQFDDKSLYKYLVDNAKQIELKRNEVLIHEDDEPNGLYIIKSGEFMVIKHLGEANAYIIKKILSGAVIGELGHFLNLARTASVVAKTDAIVLHVSIEKLKTMQKEEPQLSIQLQTFIIKYLSKRLIHYIEQND
jgi:SulP family sulfate permease